MLPIVAREAFGRKTRTGWSSQEPARYQNATLQVVVSELGLQLPQFHLGRLRDSPIRCSLGRITLQQPAADIQQRPRRASRSETGPRRGCSVVLWGPRLREIERGLLVVEEMLGPSATRNSQPRLQRGPHSAWLSARACPGCGRADCRREGCIDADSSSQRHRFYGSGRLFEWIPFRQHGWKFGRKRYSRRRSCGARLRH